MANGNGTDNCAACHRHPDTECPLCRAQLAYESMKGQALERKGSQFVDDTVARIERVAELLAKGFSMTEVAMQLGISRSRLYEFVDTYMLRDVVSVGKAMGKLRAQDSAWNDLKITQYELMTSAVKVAISNGQN